LLEIKPFIHFAKKMLYIAVIALIAVFHVSIAAKDGNNIKLYYFDGKGRAEISRMMLHLSGKEFQDQRAGKDFDWNEAKASGKHFSYDYLNSPSLLTFHSYTLALR
jgi:hypothetical protein